jgi:hypothetical protein
MLMTFGADIRALIGTMIELPRAASGEDRELHGDRGL